MPPMSFTSQGEELNIHYRNNDNLAPEEQKQFDSCKSVCCTVPRHLNETVQLGSNVILTIGEQVTYRCRDAYHLVEGNLTLTCSANGTIDGTLPVCVNNEVKGHLVSVVVIGTALGIIGLFLVIDFVRCRKRKTKTRHRVSRTLSARDTPRPRAFMPLKHSYFRANTGFESTENGKPYCEYNVSDTSLSLPKIAEPTIQKHVEKKQTFKIRQQKITPLDGDFTTQLKSVLPQMCKKKKKKKKRKAEEAKDKTYQDERKNDQLNDGEVHIPPTLINHVYENEIYTDKTENEMCTSITLKDQHIENRDCTHRRAKDHRTLNGIDTPRAASVIVDVRQAPLYPLSNIYKTSSV